MNNAVVFLFFFLFLQFNTSQSFGSEKVENYLKRAILVSCEKAQGAGFQITGEYIATAKHVVENCNSPVIMDSEGNKTVGIRIIDSPSQDISFIEVNRALTENQVLSDFREGASKVVFTVGAPIDGLVMSQGNYLGPQTNNGTDYLRLRIPADHGNSGGPVFQDEKVVGLVVLKSEIDSSIYAIKASQVQDEFNNIDNYVNNVRLTEMPTFDRNRIFGIYWQFFASGVFTLGLIFGLVFMRVINMIRKPKLPKIRLSI